MSQSHFTLPQFPVPTGGFLELIYGLITDVENRHFWILPDQQRNELFPHIIGLSLLIYFRSFVFKKPSWSHFLPVPSPHLSFSPLLPPCTCSVCLLCGLLSGKRASSHSTDNKLPAPSARVTGTPPHRQQPRSFTVFCFSEHKCIKECCTSHHHTEISRASKSSKSLKLNINST